MPAAIVGQTPAQSNANQAIRRTGVCDYESKQLYGTALMLHITYMTQFAMCSPRCLGPTDGHIMSSTPHLAGLFELGADASHHTQRRNERQTRQHLIKHDKTGIKEWKGKSMRIVCT